VIVKKISLPSMSDQELSDTIQKEAAQHIPFDLADVNLDYQILSDDATNPQMDVLLVAVKKDKILNYTNVLSMAGKTPAIVDFDALALQNCYEYNYEPAPKKFTWPAVRPRFRVWWKHYARNSPCRWNCSIRSRKCWRPSMGRQRNWWNRMPVS